MEIAIMSAAGTRLHTLFNASKRHLYCFLFLALAIVACSGRSLFLTGADKALLQIVALDDQGLIQLLSEAPTDEGEESHREVLLSQARQVQLNIAKLMIDSGARVNARNKEGQTPLMLASAKGRDFLAALLLLGGAKPELKDSHGKTARELASKNKHKEILRLLDYANRISEPMRPGSVANKLDELLYNAAQDGSASSVRLLLDMGANPNAAAFFPPDSTPLIIAAMYGRENVVRLLLDRGADVNAIDTEGQTALYLAVWYGVQNPEVREYLGVIKALLEHKVPLNAITKTWGNTALSFAIRAERTDIIEMLLSCGADPNVVHPNEMTPLMMAVGVDNLKVITSLIAHGANVNYANSKGITALCSTFNPQVALLLLKHGADVNHPCGGGETVLLWALRGRSIELAKAYIENGADVNIVGKDGRTALSLAHGPIADMIRKAGAKR